MTDNRRTKITAEHKREAAKLKAPWQFRHQPQSLMADANGCITGPKGGRYRLTPEGRKKYGC